MAKYNLWEQSGKPTSYRPMPTGWGNNIPAPPLQNMDLVLRFRAKSPSGARLRVTDTGGISISKTWILGTELDSYEMSWLQKPNPAGIFCFYDDNSIGDIVIEDIQLFEKPLGRATINGLDGFRSGRWNIGHLTPETIIVDDQTMSVKVVSAFSGPWLTMEVVPNEDYTISYDKLDANCYCEMSQSDSPTTGYATFNAYQYNGTGFTFKPTKKYVRVTFSANALKSFTVSRPMLNLGTAPAPYEKKRGERMVPPQPAKNLVRESEVTITAPTTTNVIHDELVPTEIGKIYTISAIIPTGVVIQPRIGSSSIIYGASNLIGDGSRKSMVIVSVDKFITLRKYSNGVVGTFVIKEIQVEENEFRTAFEPYRAQDLRKARKIPKKNMFNGWYEEGYLTSTVFNEKPNTATQGQRTTGWMYCKPNTNYVISGGDRSSWHFKNADGVINAGSATEAITTPSDAYFMRCYYTSNGTHERVQVEEGTVATTFEPFSSVPRKASKIIPGGKNLFNGKLRMGALLGADGSEVGSAAMAVPDYYIPVDPNTVYTIAPLRYVFYYDANKNYISPQKGNGDNSAYTFTTPANCAFLRFSVNSTTTDFKVQLEKGSATPFEDFKGVSRPAPKGLEFNNMINQNISCGVVDLSNASLEVEMKIKLKSIPSGTHALFVTSTYATGILLNQIGAYLYVYIGSGTNCLAINNFFEIDKELELKFVFDKVNNDVRIYKNGVQQTFSLISANVNYAGIVAQSLYIAGAASPSSFPSIDGAIRYAKVKKDGVTILEHNYANPAAIVGTKVKAKIGPDGTLIGSPIQLNRQARR